MELLLVSLASFLAGLIDAIVGGGGLILLPALFATFPQAHPATLMGTNKSASVWGTAWATWRYARRIQLPWQRLLPAAVVSFLAALCGAWLVTRIPAEPLRKALPFIMLAVLVYTWWKKDLGHTHQPRYTHHHETLVLCLIAAVIGFYDGFFGPGTGSFFVFALVRGLGYDFLHASAGAKLLNIAANVSAILLFASTGHIWWHLVLPMALANITGSLLGTHLALRHGTGFVRWMFLLVVSALILKTGYQAFFSTV